MAFSQPLPKYLSPSRLADFRSCPRKYQYGSVERIPQPQTYATAKGRFVHYLFEHLFLLAPEERTEAATLGFMPAAEVEVLDETTRRDVGVDEALLEKLRGETRQLVANYFLMENPAAVVNEGVERKISVEVDGTPLYGILDRLDRDEDGHLVIVDYKTGSVPSRDYDAFTFANAEFYALLCEQETGEAPIMMRLLYVAKGSVLERPVRPATIAARRQVALDSWAKINRFYDEGDFPATPSSSACRFCAYKTECRASGVAVVGR
jgi:putative RecB family exonuclease